MATIRKRGNSYQIRVSCGYNTAGEQIIQTKTWKPDAKMTAKQIEKELNRQAVMFEEACMNGQIMSNVKFQEFAEQWFKEYAEIKLKTQTIRCYHNNEKRVYEAIGHMKISKITTRNIQQFINQLATEKRYSKNGEELKPLSPKTIKNYISFVSSIFDYAVKMQVVNSNPCKNAVLPSPKTKEREIYSLEEVKHMLELFEEEDETNFKYTIFFTLAAFTGLRRGELLGLEWKDIDWENNLIHVIRTSEYTKEKGIYTDTPKTKSSIRFIKVPDEVITKLKLFHEWQGDYKTQLGDKWVECDRLFTKWNGEPMGMRSPYKFFEKFCERTGMRFVNIHSFRHFNASILINNGVDVKTVQGCLGHSCATTTLNTYAHTFQESQIKAMDSVADCILGSSTKDNVKDKSDSNIPA